MTFKQLLIKKLNWNPESKQAKLLPKGFQKIGNIIILNLKPELKKHKKIIAEKTLELFPKVKTICSKEGQITGKFRKPQIKVLAGDPNTTVTHIESGCKFRFDITKVMFAKGNLSERVRIARQVQESRADRQDNLRAGGRDKTPESQEIIVDMFAGIGYFSVPIGKLAKPKKLYCIELNPEAFQYLKENIKINHIRNTELINKDCKKAVNKLAEQGIKADRILMGYLPPPKEFLPYAMKIAKSGTIIHYEELVNTDKKDKEVKRVVSDVKEVAKKSGFDIKLIKAQKVKSYGPKIDHYVFDIEIL